VPINTRIILIVCCCVVATGLAAHADETASVYTNNQPADSYSDGNTAIPYENTNGESADYSTEPVADTAQEDSAGWIKDFLPESFLKEMPAGPLGKISVGGNYRFRYHREINMRPGATGGGLSGLDDSFQLHRTRVWLDGEVNPRITYRVGFIDAASFGETFPERGREVNRHDLYQAHANIVLCDNVGKLTARVGRQEVLYGSGRLMMAPGWANRGRAHDGVRFIWETENWEVNPFWIRPATRNRDTFRTFDNPNPEQQLYGVFATKKRSENSKLDLYWLAFDLQTMGDGARYDTIGGRLYGNQEEWLYEFEGGIQLGENPGDTSHTAAFCTLGVGYKFEDVAWKPELWAYYDWASGDNTTGNGFHPYVQRAHYYLGFMDLFARRNLEDFNLKLSVKPTSKLTLLAWCHFFSLANGNDVPYNLNTRPYAGLPAGSAGSQTLGTELDLLATYDVNESTQLRFGYSHFWAGSFYNTTPGVLSNLDANFAYAHYLYRF